jgi:hypothetical protein
LIKASLNGWPYRPLGRSAHSGRRAGARWRQGLRPFGARRSAHVGELLRMRAFVAGLVDGSIVLIGSFKFKFKFDYFNINLIVRIEN